MSADLWTKCARALPFARAVCRSHSPWHLARRANHRDSDQTLSGHQSQYGQGAWPGGAADAARARRRGVRVRRREFITLLVAAATWPLAARAQQFKVARIGALYIGTAD